VRKKVRHSNVLSSGRCPGVLAARMRPHSAASRRCPCGNSASGATAGPFNGIPSGANCDPWHGQSQHCSTEFQ